MLIKIIFINIAVFVILRLSAIFITLTGGSTDFMLNLVGVPADTSALLYRVWTIFTYMFVQYDILHILFNMLWLYWFGSIFCSYFTNKQFVMLYIYGGIAGALLYILAYNIFPYFAASAGSAYLIGASASVIAIVIATAMRAPDYQMNLLFFGGVSLKWIAAVTILIDFLSIDSTNAGGHIAHLGGAFAGFIFCILYGKGIDITKPINQTIDRIVAWRQKLEFNHKLNFKKPKAKTKKQPDKMNDEDIAKMDIILEKIKRSGYSSLTSEEKKKLFDVTKNK